MAGAAHDMLQEMLDYVGFTDQDARVLREVGPLVEPDFDRIVRRFYEALESNARARLVLHDEAMVARHQSLLREWLAVVFQGVYDTAYFAQRARIGRAHVRIGLDQRYMFSSMSVVRFELLRALEARLPEHGVDAAKTAVAQRALNRILDIELAIMLETYAEDYARKVRASERLATLGQLAGSIGHELRNPLSVIETSLHILRPELARNEKAAKHAARIGAHVELCSEIITDLLELARDRPAQRQSVSPRAIVEEVLGLLPSSAVKVDLRIPEGLPEVRVDPGQVRQLLVNLISNAVEATTGRGERVEVDVDVVDGELRLRVDDDGPGIPEGLRELLFEPLFTTRAKGVGLGLSLCQRVATKHGGSIVATNRPEGGARFEARLPAAG